MPQFKLLKEEQIANEWCWTYQLLITFNYQAVNKLTITDHIWKKTGREVITKELICDIFQEKLNGKLLEPTDDYFGPRKVFEWEIDYQGKDYFLVFWFENNNSDWLWVRNCYRIN